MGPDATTLYGRYRTTRTIWTTRQTKAVQSDAVFSGSYVEEAVELGKLMLYQLSYSRSMTYGWWGLEVSTQVSIQDPI